MNKTFGPIVLICIGMPLAAYGDSRLSEKEACKRAMQDSKQMRADMPASNMCSTGQRTLKQACTNFLSNSAQGWAKISITYTKTGCQAMPPWNEQPHEYQLDYTFQKFDQGWRMQRDF